jgi:hypothetical protein
MRQRRREASAGDSNSPKVHRRNSGLTDVQIKPVEFAMSRSTPAKFFFSCCGSVSALRAAAWCGLQAPAKQNVRRRGQ